jgi:hypothetical protein
MSGRGSENGRFITFSVDRIFVAADGNESCRLAEPRTMLRATLRKKGAEMTRLRSSILPLALLASSLLPVACGGGSDSPPAVCGELESYTPTTTNQVSFATEVYPILSNASATGAGCAQASICHGVQSIGINAAGTVKLQFVFDPPDPAMARANLLMASVNASGMQRVAPGSVKNSFMSYKISGKDGLSCISSMCQAHASIGNTTACGDAMPTVGMLSAAERTKILDWIASGASD